MVSENMRGYLVAFNRNRDQYNLPAALAEIGYLRALVTDLYTPDWLVKICRPTTGLLNRRHHKLLPSTKVKWNLPAIWLQLLALYTTTSENKRARLYSALDVHLSKAASRMGQQAALSGLFLYSGYALEAFQEASASAHKLLFVYHPLGGYAEHILRKDLEQHPEVALSHRAHLKEIQNTEGDRFLQEILLADEVVCASSFTACSVREALTGSLMPIHIVPYGVEVIPATSLQPKSERPCVLFVGQGVQRKGLHHLLKVWSQGLYREADLRLVLNRIDPGIENLISKCPGPISIRKALSHDELHAEFQNADIFAMPSLIEGFGLVYLEALASGCYVIGTFNTGLPDLNLPNEYGKSIQAGNLPALEDALRKALHSVQKMEINRNAIREFAASLTWHKFREGIQKVVISAGY